MARQQHNQGRDDNLHRTGLQGLELRGDRQRSELYAAVMEQAEQFGATDRLMAQIAMSIGTWRRSVQADLTRMASAIEHAGGTAVSGQWLCGHFMQAYPEFVSYIEEICPGLTPEQAQICFMMAMKLSAAEIARLLNCSLPSIDRHQALIRSKIDFSIDGAFDTLYGRAYR